MNIDICFFLEVFCVVLFVVSLWCLLFSRLRDSHPRDYTEYIGVPSSPSAGEVFFCAFKKLYFPDSSVSWDSLSVGQRKDFEQIVKRFAVWPS